MVLSTHATIAAKLFDRDRLVRICDWLAVALATSLPWSTSATSILVGLWLVVLVPTLDVAGLRRELLTPAGGLPVLLFALGVVGMIWADVPFAERLRGVDSFLKLLVIPLLMLHFKRSDHGAWVIEGFLLSCGVLLILSWIIWFFPNFPLQKGVFYGVPVKDHLSQSAMFTMCVAVAIERALDSWRKARSDLGLVWLLVALAFLANIVFVVTSRTALVAIPILLVLFGFKRLGWKGTVGALVVLFVLAAAAWPLSSYFRFRISNIPQEWQAYRAENARTSIGERLEFWTKGLRIVAEAPLIGHGTGTIHEQFRRVATGETGASSLVTPNPHNQTLAVAIQLGLVGTAVLYAMWIAHLLLFRGGGSAAWIGLAVVVQNVVGSLFNSHLFDFTHGWGYVIGVGIAGGVSCAANSRAPEANATGTVSRKRDKVDVP